MGIYKVGKTWYIDYYADGQRIREPASKKKAEAEEMLEARKTDIKRGEFRLPGKEKSNLRNSQKSILNTQK